MPGSGAAGAVFFSATILSSSVDRRQRSIVATPADNPNFSVFQADLILRGNILAQSFPFASSSATVW